MGITRGNHVQPSATCWYTIWATRIYYNQWCGAGRCHSRDLACSSFYWIGNHPWAFRSQRHPSSSWKSPGKLRPSRCYWCTCKVLRSLLWNNRKWTHISHRWAGIIKRRVYKVRGSNALWHQDGNEKLRHWGFWVHGCVDGHSRLIIYLECCSNKRSQTVLDCFRRAIAIFGWPSRIRGDLGTENNGIEILMIEHWGAAHRAYLREGNVEFSAFTPCRKLKDTLDRSTNKFGSSVYG